MSDLDDFAPLGFALDDIAQNVSPREMRKLGSAIGTDLRSANAKRIKANVTPEGDAMAPRKGKPRRLRSTAAKGKAKMGRMFQRATSPRYLRREATDGGVQVGYVGAMARIMRVHHFGLRDTVTRDPKAPAVAYPERPLIDITADDRLRILEKVSKACNRTSSL